MPASSVVAYYEAVREALLEVATSKRSQTVVLSLYSLYSIICSAKEGKGEEKTEFQNLQKKNRIENKIENRQISDGVFFLFVAIGLAIWPSGHLVKFYASTIILLV